MILEENSDLSHEHNPDTKDQLTDDLVKAILQQILEKKTKNGRFGLRYLASTLEIDASQLSRFLKSRKGVSFQKIMEMGKALPMDEDWLRKVDSLMDSKGEKIMDPLSLLPIDLTEKYVYQIIWELGHLRDFEASADWVSGKTGLPKELAEKGLELYKNLLSNSKNLALYKKSRGQIIENWDTQLELLQKMISSPANEMGACKAINTMIVPLNGKKLRELQRAVVSCQNKIKKIASKQRQVDGLYAISFVTSPLSAKK